jgi:hypothetical protein
MKAPRIFRRFTAMAAGQVLMLSPLHAAESSAAAPASAAQLAETLSAKQQDGTSYIRLKMDFASGGGKEALQVQIKSMAGSRSTQLVYQILWPKERKGEGVLLRKSGRSFSGVAYRPQSGAHNLEGGQLRESLFGSALSYEDVLDNFFAWDQQTLAGTETVNGVPCQILESKPKGASSYSMVRSWIDTRRMVPLRVEKYAGGRLARRIDTTRVANDDRGHPIPANLVVHNLRDDSTTDLDGSRIRHDVSFSDAEFTAEGLKQVSGPKGAE